MKLQYTGLPESIMKFGGVKTEGQFIRKASRWLVLISFLLLVACGGGGGGGGGGTLQVTLPLKTLSWKGPTQFVDNSTIPAEPPGNPYKFRIYVNTDNTAFSELNAYYEIPDINWSDNTDYVYTFPLNTPLFVSMFNLKAGTDYYIKMRVVVGGIPSEFTEVSQRFRFGE
ncbi:hypothetical protein [Candidatus Deferrimicrobium sp.]|uniref:hypothetical protein n=1 Tax=Candidatus Deferrimicrobium sp. TaxID=3060586 RepID=UPI00271A2AE0|nr:hypothetical protein [Candidatus Deferrimicrobium sp.]MDO8739466.1 hypothetical protein [Candidatus Deferrimicrobium sp.]